MRLLDGGRCMVSNFRIEPRMELGSPTPIPPDVKVGPAMSGGSGDPFFGYLYVDGTAPMHVQRDDGDDSALHVSAS